MLARQLISLAANLMQEGGLAVVSPYKAQARRRVCAAWRPRAPSSTAPNGRSGAGCASAACTPFGTAGAGKPGPAIRARQVANIRAKLQEALGEEVAQHIDVNTIDGFQVLLQRFSTLARSQQPPHRGPAPRMHSAVHSAVQCTVQCSAA